MSSDMFTRYEGEIFDDWMKAQGAVEAFLEKNGIDRSVIEELHDLEEEVDETRRFWMHIYDTRTELKRRHYWEDASGASYEVWDLVAVFESEEDENDWLAGFDQWLRCVEREGRFIRRDK